MLNMKIGLFGYGRIGTKIHELLKGFTNDFYTINRGKGYPKEVKTVENLSELVKVSDIIMISTPLNETTKHIFDQTILSKMKDKYIINVGRGLIVKEEDLYNALKNKTLKGYASDVWYNYPRGKETCLPSTFPIYDFENVVLSNHSGGFTTKTNDLVNQDIIETLQKLQKQNYEDRLDLTKLI
jgi:phosphoglycerate dehydrogenase-like enzyme